jgi:hypothetical protein
MYLKSRLKINISEVLMGILIGNIISVSFTWIQNTTFSFKETTEANSYIWKVNYRNLT